MPFLIIGLTTHRLMNWLQLILVLNKRKKVTGKDIQCSFPPEQKVSLHLSLLMT